MKAAIYTRFSSDNQTELSTQAQVRACTEYAKANGLDIYKIYSVGWPGRWRNMYGCPR